MREGIEQRAAFLCLDRLPSHFRAAHSLCQARGLDSCSLKLMLGLGGPLQPCQQVVQTIGDLPEHVLAGQRRSRLKIPVGRLDVRLENLLNALL